MGNIYHIWNPKLEPYILESLKVPAYQQVCNQSTELRKEREMQQDCMTFSFEGMPHHILLENPKPLVYNKTKGEIDEHIGNIQSFKVEIVAGFKICLTQTT